MSNSVIDLAGLAAELSLRSRTGRVILALAGPPGSGKSTAVEHLAALLNAEKPDQAAILPMDGYHLDDLYLVPAGLRPRKGLPETFDPDGLRHMLMRLRARAETRVAVPVFDRDLEIARAGARFIGADVPIILVEGLYLLLREEPWSLMRPMFDMTVMMDVPEAVLRQRLTARWQGYELSPDEIAWKLDGNDLPNGRYVMAQSIAADYRLQP